MPHDVFNYVQIGIIYHGIKFLNSVFVFIFIFVGEKDIYGQVSLTSDKSNTTIVVFASKGAILILIAW